MRRSLPSDIFRDHEYILIISRVAVPGQPRIRPKTWIDGAGQPQAGVYELFELPAQRQGRTADQHLCVHREYNTFYFRLFVFKLYEIFINFVTRNLCNHTANKTVIWCI